MPACLTHTPKVREFCDANTDDADIIVTAEIDAIDKFNLFTQVLSITFFNSLIDSCLHVAPLAV